MSNGQSDLNTINKINLDYEKRTVLYNLSFIRILQEKYQLSYERLTQIPPALLKCKHYFALTYNLFLLNNFEAAKEMCQKGLGKTDDPFYHNFLEEFAYFFQNNDCKIFTNSIIRIYQNEKTKLDRLTKEYFSVMIIKLCNLTGQKKRTVSFLENLYQNQIY